MVCLCLFWAWFQTLGRCGRSAGAEGVGRAANCRFAALRASTIQLTSTSEIAGKQAVKQVLAGLPSNREPSGDISTRMQAALYRLADIDILRLHPVTYGSAVAVVLLAFGTRVSEEEVKQDQTLVRPEWENQVGVHDSLVDVDHEI